MGFMMSFEVITPNTTRETSTFTGADNIDELAG